MNPKYHRQFCDILGTALFLSLRARVSASDFNPIGFILIIRAYARLILAN
jgi:hypothetical protein